MAIKFTISLTLLVLCTSNAFKIDGRIAHGHNAIPKIAPFIVSLQVETEPGKYHHSCGGTIIDKHWIVTAGHCLSGDDDRASKQIIRAGRYNITAEEPTEQQRKIDWYKIHADYDIDIGVAPNDIALIYVKEPFVWTDSVQPIALPKSGSKHNGIATLYGWGLLSFNSAEFADILQTGDIPIITNDECIKRLNLSDEYLVDPSNICTVSNDGISACSSDSGGPLIQQNSHNELIGIVSWGPPCGQLNGASVSVYVRVSSFIEWIKNVQKEFNNFN